MSPHCAAISYRLKLTEQITRAQNVAKILFPHAVILLARLTASGAHQRTTRDKAEENRTFSSLCNIAKAITALLMKARRHGNVTAAEQLSRLQNVNTTLLTHIGNTIIQLDAKKGAAR